MTNTLHHGDMGGPDWEKEFLEAVERKKAEIIEKVPEAVDEVDNMQFEKIGMHVHLVRSSVSDKLWAKIKKAT